MINAKRHFPVGEVPLFFVSRAVFKTLMRQKGSDLTGAFAYFLRIQLRDIQEVLIMDNFLIYDSLLYAIYTASDFNGVKEELLAHLQQMIPHQYASILITEGGNRKGTEDIGIAEFYCEPSEFMEAEELLIKKYPEELTTMMNLAEKAGAIRRSGICAEEERFCAPYYKDCYEKYDIYDTLQLAVTSKHELIAVISLYRTTESGAFADEDVYLLKALSKHLSKVFCKHCRQNQTIDSVSGTIEEIKAKVHMTPKETEILTLIFLAKSNLEICEELKIKEHTLQKHLQNIYRKLNVCSRWELLRFAVPNGHDGMGRAV
jgi:DNA-binding CsgD family transcriptional regulator